MDACSSHYTLTSLISGALVVSSLQGAASSAGQQCELTAIGDSSASAAAGIAPAAPAGHSKACWGLPGHHPAATTRCDGAAVVLAGGKGAGGAVSLAGAAQGAAAEDASPLSACSFVQLSGTGSLTPSSVESCGLVAAEWQQQQACLQQQQRQQLVLQQRLLLQQQRQAFVQQRVQQQQQPPTELLLLLQQQRQAQQARPGASKPPSGTKPWQRARVRPQQPQQPQQQPSDLLLLVPQHSGSSFTSSGGSFTSTSSASSAATAAGMMVAAAPSGAVCNAAAQNSAWQQLIQHQQLLQQQQLAFQPAAAPHHPHSTSSASSSQSLKRSSSSSCCQLPASAWEQQSAAKRTASAARMATQLQLRQQQAVYECLGPAPAAGRQPPVNNLLLQLQQALPPRGSSTAPANQHKQEQELSLALAAAAAAVPRCRLDAPASRLLCWAGRVLSCQLQDAYLLASHIFKRVSSRLDDMLLISLGVTAPSQSVTMLISLWVATKLEGHRRQVAGASKLAAALQLLPGVVVDVEVHLMGLLDWQPYAGWQPEALAAAPGAYA